jgi:hypothetical protein
MPKQNSGNSRAQREQSNRSVIPGHCEAEKKVWRQRDTSQNGTAFRCDQERFQVESVNCMVTIE